MILLDTNVVSELMRPAPDLKVRAWLDGLGATSLSTSAVTIAEVVFGLARLPVGQRRSELLEQFDALILGPPALPVLGLDEQASRLAGEFRALRESLRLWSSPSDMMIAGIAAANGASLATRNVADFSGLPISVVNPWG
jgi:toxin FitB